MTKTILAFFLFCFISVCAFAQSVPKAIDSLIGAYAKLNKFNGNIVVIKSGETVFNGSYGFRDVEKGIKCNGNEIFQLASLSKTFTAVLTMKLIEEGKLSLNTRISDFFPVLHPEQKITVAQLLGHTSGIREVLADSALREKVFSGLKADREELLQYFSSQRLEFTPGSEFSYSNSGYDLLGMIIEKVTGMQYGEAVSKMIFRPLGMRSSGYDYSRLKSGLKTVGYEYLSSGRFVTAKIWDESWTYASGGLYSSVGDLVKWNDALRHNKVISSRALAECYTPGKGDYGYGWFIDSLYEKKIAYHPGNLEGATSYFARIPQDDICIIMLTNQTSTIIESIGSKIIAILNKKPYALPKPKQEILVSTKTLTSYIGSYDISGSYATSVDLISGNLYLSTANAVPVRLFAESQNRFFIADSNMTLTFNVGKDGKLSLTIKSGLSTKIGGRLD